MGGQPAGGVKADDRRLQVGGQYQQNCYTTQGVKKLVARDEGLIYERDNSAFNQITNQKGTRQNSSALNPKLTAER